MLAVLMKILGIIGIVLLCLLLVLFWPVSYRIDAHRDDAGTGLALKARWLLGFIRISYLYPDPGRLKVRLLFYTIYDSGREKKHKQAKDKGAESTDPDHESHQKKRGIENNNRPDGESDWKYESLAEPDSQDAGLPKSSSEEHNPVMDMEEKTGQQKAENVETSPEEENNEASGGIFNLLNNKITKIKYTILKICDKIKHILENLSYYRDLLGEEETKLLFGQVWARVYKIIKILHPRKLSASIKFGTGSPDTTGYILGLYCMLSPFLGQNINIDPDFEEAVLTGELHAVGRITVFILLLNGVGILLDKDLRIFIRRMKREDA